MRTTHIETPARCYFIHNEYYAVAANLLDLTQEVFIGRFVPNSFQYNNAYFFLMLGIRLFESLNIIKSKAYRCLRKFTWDTERLPSLPEPKVSTDE